MSPSAHSYDFWQRALAGEEVGGPTLPIHDGEAHPGFYRKRASRAGAFLPVAIWEHEGALIALVDGKQADPAEVWSYCCRFPVTNEAYNIRVETGMWPDEDGAVAASLTPAASQEIGANNPPIDDPATEIQRKIDTAAANAKDYEKIEDDETAGKAQSVRSRLLELAGEADKAREALKRPHLDANKAIDSKWQPIVKAGELAANKIRETLSAFATAQRKKAEEAAAQAEKIARGRALAEAKAAEDAANAAAKGGPAPPPLPPAPEPVAPPPAVPTQIGGAYGRKASVRTIRVAKVVDQDKAYAAMRTHKELVEFIAKLAQRAIDKGVAVDGVTVEEREDVR